MKKGNVSIKEAADILGKGEQFVRIALQRNLLPIGTAVKNGKKWNYQISPFLLEKYVGVEMFSYKKWLREEGNNL